MKWQVQKRGGRERDKEGRGEEGRLRGQQGRQGGRDKGDKGGRVGGRVGVGEEGTRQPRKVGREGRMEEE